MRNITVLPDINRVSVCIGKYFGNTNKYDISLGLHFNSNKPCISESST